MLTGVVTALDTVTWDRVSAQNAAVYREHAQTLPQCAPANEILFRRRGHVRSEVTFGSGTNKDMCTSISIREPVKKRRKKVWKIHTWGADLTGSFSTL